LPHGIAVDSEGTIYVADREGDRLQLFSPEGDYLTEWTQVERPAEVFIGPDGRVYVAELGWQSGLFPGATPPRPNPVGGRVSIFSPDGKLEAQWGGGEHPCAPGDFYAPHDIWVDRRGDIYVGEVTMSAGGYAGKVPPDCHVLQKFTTRNSAPA
jgi:sugar lactone lactonase YvrE